jgi:hypothetical protein
MQTRSWLPHSAIFVALCGTLCVAPNKSFAQSIDQPQDTPRTQSVPHAPRTYEAQGKARSAELAASASSTQPITQLCVPEVTDNIIVATAAQRKRAGDIALPPLTDHANGFAWPDTELGVIKTPDGYAFFGSDGAFHARQDWEEEIEGNNKYGSITRTIGTLSNPLGSEAPSLFPSGAAYWGPMRVNWNTDLRRYQAFINNGNLIAYAESPDGLSWSVPTVLKDFSSDPNQPGFYITLIGLGEEPHLLGKQFYIMYTYYPNNGEGWNGASVRRFTVSCQ